MTSEKMNHIIPMRKLQVVGAVLVLADDGREPAEEHVGEQHDPRQEDPAAGPVVEVADRTGHHGE
jgi:hypothetical protein